MQMLHRALLSKLILLGGIRSGTDWSHQEVAFCENTQESRNQKDRQQKKSEKRDSPSGGLSGTDAKAFGADGTLISKREAKGWGEQVGAARTAQDSGFTDECVEN